ncbi:MAG: 50S ribosomal protein L21 [Geminicoccaceae bacterium]
MYAVIKTGGKQYRVASGDVLTIEKLTADVGSTIDLDHVLMIGGESPVVGTPRIEGATVKAEVLAQKRGEKLTVFKKRRRKNSRRRNGHRQYLTVVRINDILAA